MSVYVSLPTSFKQITNFRKLYRKNKILKVTLTLNKQITVICFFVYLKMISHLYVLYSVK